ncbi:MULTISPECIES: DeoR family transcriptional regulator [unclassified Streptomyces]|uniref:DeoR family transcriptional regulator n=1 Tax=unclassified Streptomyces TaxID=2593676 RepID=UPI00338E2D5B
MADLSNQLGVSAATVRRDLLRLEEHGLLTVFMEARLSGRPHRPSPRPSRLGCWRRTR